MNFTVLNVVLIGAGGILLYSAIKDQMPIDVLRTALGQETKSKRTARDRKNFGDYNHPSINPNVPAQNSAYVVTSV